MGRKLAWKPEEDEIVRQCVMDAKSKNLADRHGMQLASEKTGRSESSCATRWYAFLSKGHDQSKQKAESPSDMSADSFFAYVRGLELKVKTLSKELEYCNERIKDFEGTMRVLKRAQIEVPRKDQPQLLRSKQVFIEDVHGNFERLG